MCVCVCVSVRPLHFVCPPGDKHFSHTGGGGGGHTFFVGDGGGYDDVDEESDMSKANFLASAEREREVELGCPPSATFL